jgi:hypothetical protein
MGFASQSGWVPANGRGDSNDGERRAEVSLIYTARERLERPQLGRDTPDIPLRRQEWGESRTCVSTYGGILTARVPGQAQHDQS